MRASSLAAAVCAASCAGAASAAIVFTASLDGSQEASPNASTATGMATLTLNDLQNRLEIMITISGLDLDGNQTADPNDDVTGAHIHRAPPGVNGPVVFGFIGPDNDLNGDLMVDPVAGTIFSAWDLNEGNSTTLAAELTHLLNENLYINVHTVAFGGGEIRGQIVPTPGGAAVLGLAGISALRRRRAHG